MIRAAGIAGTDETEAMSFLLALDADLFDCDPESVAKHFDVLKTKDCYAEWDIRFLVTGSRLLCMTAEFDETGMEMLNILMDIGDDARKVTAEALLLERYENRGELDKLDVILPELESMLESTEIECREKFVCYGSMTNACQWIHDKARAGRCLEHMKQLLRSTDMPVIYRTQLETEYDEFEAVWYIENNEPQKAIEPLLHRTDRLLRLTGKNSLYIGTLSLLALAYLRTREYEKAGETYERIIRDVGEDTTPFSFSVILNNYAVLCIEQERAAKAIELLKQCVERVADQPSALAEPYRNLGRAYDLLQDRENALYYWQAAYPLLCANYGKEHERSMAAAERIDELKK